MHKAKIRGRISFKWGVDLKDIYKPNIDANDNANYKDLNQFIPLAKDQKIVSVNKPIVKDSGIDIFGNKIDFLPVNAFFKLAIILLFLKTNCLWLQILMAVFLLNLVYCTLMMFIKLGAMLIFILEILISMEM